MPTTELTPGATWRSAGFSAAVALCNDVVAQDDPASCLLDAGRKSI
jgi:hypothetical protein